MTTAAPIPPPPSQDTLLLVAYLSDRDVPCPACHYNLRGINSPACPECAAPVRLSIELELHRNLGLLISRIVALSLGAATTSVMVAFLAFGIYQTNYRGLGPPLQGWQQITLAMVSPPILLGTLCTTLVLITRKRRRTAFLALDHTKARKRTAATWAWVMVSFSAWFTLLILVLP